MNAKTQAPDFCGRSSLGLEATEHDSKQQTLNPAPSAQQPRVADVAHRVGGALAHQVAAPETHNPPQPHQNPVRRPPRPELVRAALGRALSGWSPCNDENWPQSQPPQPTPKEKPTTAIAPSTRRAHGDGSSEGWARAARNQGCVSKASRAEAPHANTASKRGSDRALPTIT